ncbi:MAG: hypothetical protein PHR64_03105 [Candidatus Shapirobacteria bacterium]|nr:hypothetical protein [Candidatus Shapirobacteria bacterium]MDD5481905.1 hypothetical protein [Candidatus Shapirobacteria bacterium]
MKERINNSLNMSENFPPEDYEPVLICSQTMSLEDLEPDIRNKLLNVEGLIAVKGGFARELFRFNLGLSSQYNHAKLEDLDIVVFETPSTDREERIARRNQIASLSKYFEPKDIEICNSIPEGLIHFFRTRDVTMNELVMFKHENHLRFLFSQECLEDLTNRIIRPSIHCAHTGLGLVWFQQEDERLLSAAMVGRCIYRRVKGDGDIFISDRVDFLDSARTLNADELFKIIKRFSEIPHLFEACTRIYRELGINNEALAEVRKRIEDPRIKKSRGMITSEIVEDMLDERKREYEEWLRGAGNSQRAVAEVRFI